MAFNLVTPIANGDGYADVKSRLVTLVEAILGAGQASVGNTPADWGAMRTKLNTILTAFNKTTIGSSDTGAVARAKINGIINIEALVVGVVLGWWNADRSDLLTLVGSAVSSWKDSLSGYDAIQATSAARPSYSATSFNGLPSLTLDGADDYLELASQPFPSGSTPSEIWTVVQQDAIISDATVRRAFAYGAENNNARYVAHSGNSAQFVFNTFVGNGSAVLGSNINGFTGRKLTRSLYSAAQVQGALDGVLGTATAAVPATGTTRTRIGASSGASPTGFWQGKIRDILVTAALTTDQETYLKNIFLPRKAP